MVDRDVKRALLRAYRNGIVRYQKLLKTHQAEVERDYIKERLSACNAAVKALSGPEPTAICIWKLKYLAESRQRRSESGVFRKRQFEPLESYNGALPKRLPGSNALQVSAHKQSWQRDDVAVWPKAAVLGTSGFSPLSGAKQT